MRRLLNLSFFVARRLSTEVGSSESPLSRWASINREGEHKAEKIVAKEVQIQSANLQGEIHGVREQISGLKSELHQGHLQIKQELSRKLSEMQTQIAINEANLKTKLVVGFEEIHEQQTNGVRLTFFGLFGAASAVVAINQYLSSEEDYQAPHGVEVTTPARLSTPK